MSPRPRNPLNRGLPARWRRKHGAYYYRPRDSEKLIWDGKSEFRLGKTLPEAYRTYADRAECIDRVITMLQLFERYELEVIPLKQPKSQESNHTSLRRLRPVFGAMRVEDIKPKDAYAYMSRIAKLHGEMSANRDYEVLSHSLSKAVEWGVIDRNDLKGQVKKYKRKKRTRYIEDWEMEAFRSVAHPTLVAFTYFKQLTGLRASDILRIRTVDFRDEGIFVPTSKTDVPLIIAWSDELRYAVDFALDIRPRSDTDLLFCNRKGNCYATADGKNSGFKSLWQRSMAKALAKSDLEEKFWEIDIRRKTASDMTPGDAQRLLAHKDLRTTQRYYRVKPDVVKPHSVPKPSQDPKK